VISATLVLAALSGTPALAAAPASARLAVTPEDIRTTPTTILAERLVDRLRRECDEAGAPGTGAAPAEGARLVMMVPEAVMASIARFGFLNQHETLTTGGFDKLEERFEAEQELAMARLPYDLHGRELLPKYAFLDAPDRGLGRFLLPRRYGEVAVVFKKSVNARATWTYADTLDFSRRAGRFDRGGEGNPVLARTFSYRRKPGDHNRCVNYCEAQIWGELNLGDVEYLMIPPGAKVPAGAATARLPVYRYSVPTSTAAAGAPARTLVYARGTRVKVPAVETLPTSLEFRGMPQLQGVRSSFEEMRLPDDQAVRRLAESKDPGERLRLTGVLASRVKNARVREALKTALAGDDPTVRSLALYGLSDSPWTDFKPILLVSAKDADWRVRAAVAALAAEHRTEPEVAAALAAMTADARRRGEDPREDRAADELEWLSRADRPWLCAAPAR
jgi:hypothetical protein